MSAARFFAALFALFVVGGIAPPARGQSLKEAIEQTLKTNPDVLIEVARRQATGDALSQAKGGYMPKIDLSTGTGKESKDNATTRASYGGGITQRKLEQSLTLTQMLFDGFATSSEVDRSLSRVDSAEHKLAATAEQIALKAIEAYLEVLRQTQVLDLTKENLVVHQRTSDQIKVRVGGGMARKSDLDQIQARLALSGSNLTAAEANLEVAEINYKLVVGSIPKGLVNPRAPGDELIPSTPEEATFFAIENNRILKSADADVAAAQAQHRASKASLYPRFDLELGRTNSITSNSIDTAQDPTTSVMVRMRYNLFRGGADQARVGETRNQAMEAQQVRNRAERQLEQSARLAWSAYRAARDRAANLRKHAESTQLTREAYTKQFSMGQRTLLDLLDTENEYFSATTNNINGYYVELFARFRLLAELGLLLSTVGVSPAIAMQASSSDSASYSVATPIAGPKADPAKLSAIPTVPTSPAASPVNPEPKAPPVAESYPLGKPETETIELVKEENPAVPPPGPSATAPANAKKPENAPDKTPAASVPTPPETPATSERNEAVVPLPNLPEVPATGMESAPPNASPPATASAESPSIAAPDPARPQTPVSSEPASAHAVPGPETKAAPAIPVESAPPAEALSAPAVAPAASEPPTAPLPSLSPPNRQPESRLTPTPEAAPVAVPPADAIVTTPVVPVQPATVTPNGVVAETPPAAQPKTRSPIAETIVVPEPAPAPTPAIVAPDAPSGAIVDPLRLKMSALPPAIQPQAPAQLAVAPAQPAVAPPKPPIAVASDFAAAPPEMLVEVPKIEPRATPLAVTTTPPESPAPITRKERQPSVATSDFAEAPADMLHAPQEATPSNEIAATQALQTQTKPSLTSAAEPSLAPATAPLPPSAAIPSSASIAPISAPSSAELDRSASSITQPDPGQVSPKVMLAMTSPDETRLKLDSPAARLENSAPQRGSNTDNPKPEVVSPTVDESFETLKTDYALEKLPVDRSQGAGMEVSKNEFWMVELAGIMDQTKVIATWQDLKTRFAVPLENLTLLPRRQPPPEGSPDDGKFWYRLFIARFSGEKDAEALCADLREGQLKCRTVSSAALKSGPPKDNTTTDKGGR